MTVPLINMRKVNVENFQKGFHNFGHLIKYKITLEKQVHHHLKALKSSH